MSLVTVEPEMLAAAAGYLPGVGWTMSARNAAGAAAATGGFLLRRR